MAQVHCWDDLIKVTKEHFPAVNLNRLLLAKDNLGVLVREIAEAHDLTLAEASEMVVLRLPYYAPDAYAFEEERLSA